MPKIRNQGANTGNNATKNARKGKNANNASTTSNTTTQTSSTTNSSGSQTTDPQTLSTLLNVMQQLFNVATTLQSQNGSNTATPQQGPTTSLTTNTPAPQSNVGSPV